jgi:hypothetical protein
MALAAYCHGERRHQAWVQDVEAEAAEGLRLALRAVELGKDDGNVLWMAAFAVRHLAMDAHRAKQFADRSLQLNPNSAIALAIAAWIEVGMGNWAKALELARRAEVSPRRFAFSQRAWQIWGGGTRLPPWYRNSSKLILNSQYPSSALGLFFSRRAFETGLQTRCASQDCRNSGGNIH